MFHVKLRLRILWCQLAIRYHRWRRAREDRRTPPPVWERDD